MILTEEKFVLAKKYADNAYGLGCILKKYACIHANDLEEISNMSIMISHLMDNIDKLVVLLNDYNDS